jgi:type IV pilus assembly protein PilC
VSTTFEYKVRDTLGSVVAGTLEADNEDEATLKLRRDGYQILELEAEDDANVPPLFARRISRNDIVYATNQLAVMVDTGIALSTALQGMLEQEQNPTLKKVLTELRTAVEQGEDFSGALSRYPHLFDKTYIALVKASEATGSLGPMLDRIANYLRKEVETRGKVKAAMAYPTVMLTLAIGVTLFLLTFVMPKFMPLFASKGLDLPAPTKVMMVISTLLLDYWYAWIVVGALLPVGFVYGRRTEQGRQLWDWVKINLPLIGPMTRKVVISRSIRTLGTMVGSGIPILDALQLSAEVSANYYYEQLWHHVSEEVETGKQICEALSGQPLFPPMLVQMISAGEQTGKLGQVLERVSTYYDQEVETSLKGVTSVIEPIMISVMGVVVGTIGLALLLPIFSLSKAPG